MICTPVRFLSLGQQVSRLATELDVCLWPESDHYLMAAPASPRLGVCPLGDRQSVLNLNTQIPERTFQFCMAKQELDGS